jgi:hypothetical protein
MAGNRDTNGDDDSVDAAQYFANSSCQEARDASSQTGLEASDLDPGGLAPLWPLTTIPFVGLYQKVAWLCGDLTGVVR